VSEPEDFSVESEVEETVGWFAQQGLPKEIELTCFVSAAVPAWVQGDRSGLRLMLTNLIGAAVSSMEKGEVSLRVSTAGQRADSRLIRFELHVSGAGNAPEGGSPSPARWLELPLDEPLSQMPDETEPACDLAGKRVLAVDDAKSSRTILAEYLRSWQATADTAENGIEAIRGIREAARLGRPYDLVLLDLGMPGVNGIEVAGIVSRDAGSSATPIILMTSRSDGSEVNIPPDAGILASLSKPVRKQMLRKTIAGVLRRDARLLLVEDFEDTRKLAVLLLKRHGYACDTAVNGLEAVEKLKRQSYPLVLMDCEMPVMDGFEATGAIRDMERGRTSRTAIVAMTAYERPEDRARCLAAGMDDYVSKPIVERRLIATIRKWCPDHIKGKSQPGVIQVPDYIVNRRHDLVLLAAALRSRDLPAARVIGHGMKGSGTGYGFPAISEIGNRIEQCAAGRDIAGIEDQIRRLAGYLSQLEATH
jgi:CheY-like chemotaxis protein